MPTTHYFLFAGEASGDLHGSKLIQALKKNDSTGKFWGVGGASMRQEDFFCFIPTEQFQVMGFTAVFKAFPRLLRLFYKIRRQIMQNNPDVVILIDYPGFNLRLARSLRRQGYQGKIVQYICPSVWAHGKNRIQCLATYYNLLLTIYPFESDYFTETALSVKYIGNPIEENVRTYSPHLTWKECCGLPPENPLIALFPGSRQAEIFFHFPQQLEVAKRLKQINPHLLFVVCYTQENLKKNLMTLAQTQLFQMNQDIFFIPVQFTHDLMSHATMAIAKSGTVTLELALHQVPTIVHYHLTPLNRWIAKYILRLKLSYYCIVNILAQKMIFPEYIETAYTTETLSQACLDLFTDPFRQKNIKNDCFFLKQLLGQKNTHEQAAFAIQELII